MIFEKNRKMKTFFISVSIFACCQLFAQSDKVVKWTATAEQESDNTYILTLSAKIDKSWHVYSQFISDEGPVKTSVRLENADKLEMVGKSTEEGIRKEGFDDIFGMELIKFSKQMTIKQRIKSAQALDSISGDIEYMTCNNEICYPPVEVHFKTPVNKLSK